MRVIAHDMDDVLSRGIASDEDIAVYRDMPEGILEGARDKSQRADGDERSQQELLQWGSLGATGALVGCACIVFGRASHLLRACAKGIHPCLSASLKRDWTILVGVGWFHWWILLWRSACKEVIRALRVERFKDGTIVGEGVRGNVWQC